MDTTYIIGLLLIIIVLTFFYIIYNSKKKVEPKKALELGKNKWLFPEDGIGKMEKGRSFSEPELKKNKFS